MSTWNLKNIYKSNAEWEKDFHRVAIITNQIKKMSGAVKNSSDIKKMFSLEERLLQKTDKLYLYARLNATYTKSDKNKDKYKEMFHRIKTTTMTSYDSLYFIIAKELSKFPKHKLMNFIKLKKMKKFESRLTPYLPTGVRKTETKTERISYRFSSILDNIDDLSYNLYVAAEQEVAKIATNPAIDSRQKRKFIYEKEKNVRKKNEKLIFDLLTMHISSRKAHAMKDGDDSVVNNIISAYSLSEDVLESYLNEGKKFKKSYQKLAQINKKFFKYRKFYSYDADNPKLVKSRNISVETSMQTIKDALSIFGDDYLQKIKYLEKKKCINIVIPKEYNKAESECHAYSYNTDPYIFVSFNKTMEGLSTIAHEIGHGVHLLYKKQYNEYHNFMSETLVDEVIAFVNEIITLKHIINTAKTEQVKINATSNLIGLYRSFMVANAKSIHLEYEMYRTFDYNEEFSIKSIKKINKIAVNKYSVVDNKEDLIDDWASDRMLFSDFYNLQYFIAFTVASIFSNKILSGDSSFLLQYMELLKIGEKDAYKTLKELGIDIQSTDFIRQAHESFKDELVKFEELLDNYKN